MVGRIAERQILKDILNKDRSSFVAVTGRRRIGKTYLIDSFYKSNMCFRMTGIQNGNQETQLQNFAIKLAETTKRPSISAPKNWQEAFFELKIYLQSLNKKKKQVLFIDELPWVVTQRSGFLQLLAHLWNDYLSKEKHFILVVCGSASSWLVKKIVNDKGGLHNRLTNLIKLKPFTLSESKLFLESLNLKLGIQEVTKLYMSFGGVPYYLEQVRKGESATVAIERLCFLDNGLLKNEYINLYQALFKNADLHEKVIEALASKTSGLTRKELITKSKITSSGSFKRVMDDLLESGFIADFIPFGKKKKGIMFRLNDEFSMFYHKFMQSNTKYTKGMWQQMAASQKYKIWSGFAFETLCLNHIEKIKEAMGIAAVYSESSSFRVSGNKDTKGFQIDLIIDRKDATINLCEIKYYDASFKIDKKYAKQLIERKQQFIEETKTKKQVFITFISNNGLQQNEYSTGVVDSEILLEKLFTK